MAEQYQVEFLHEHAGIAGSAGFTEPVGKNPGYPDTCSQKK
jgi:hypothetical protein